jgi:hypothetical protein
MSKKPSSSPAPADADRSGGRPVQQPIVIPPPPETGGTHVWNDSLSIWQTVDETIQPWDERHPDNSAPAPASADRLGSQPAPAEQPLKDA